MSFHVSRLVVSVFAVAGTASLPAAAQSLTGNVGSAGVSEGERGIEARLGLDEEGSAASRIHYDHAFTGWYQLRVIGSFRRPDGEDWDFSALTLENWFQWSEETRDNSGFNGGIRLAYSFADGSGRDEAQVRLTVTDRFAGAWEWRANLIGEIEAGEGSDGGVGVEMRAQLTRGLETSGLGSDDWRLGMELFSEFGNSRDFASLNDQAHQIGPVIKVSWDNGIYIQSAVRAGLTDGSDDYMAKLFIGREF